MSFGDFTCSMLTCPCLLMATPFPRAAVCQMEDPAPTSMLQIRGGEQAVTEAHCPTKRCGIFVIGARVRRSACSAGQHREICCASPSSMSLCTRSGCRILASAGQRGALNVNHADRRFSTLTISPGICRCGTNASGEHGVWVDDKGGINGWFERYWNPRWKNTNIHGANMSPGAGKFAPTMT
jgi:hypothetical protein